MPDFHRHFRTPALPGARHLARGLLVVLMVVSAGCALQGDLGREAPSYAEQRLEGSKYAGLPGLKNTRYGVPFSAAETDLRTRAYALTYTFAHRSTYNHWSNVGKVLPRYLTRTKQLSAAAYVAEMETQLYASPEARINAIIDDIRADLTQIDWFWAAVQAVYADDRQRLSSISRIGDEKMARNTAGRIEENRFFVEKTLSALEVRVDGYARALARTMATMPNSGGVGADLELDGMRRRATRLHTEVRRLDERYAFAMPARENCLEQSIAGSCTDNSTGSPLVARW